MNKNSKQLSNPFSTGSGGPHFEAHVQASFVLLMAVGGCAPCLPNWPIQKIKLQGRHAGYETDDLIIYVKNPNTEQQRKILAQIKHSISITENNSMFREVIQAAWNDFNGDLFSTEKDIIALITGPLSSTEINDTRTILEWARHAENAEEFLLKVELANFSSDAKRRKLKAFRTNLTKANNDDPVSDEIFFEFLKHFHLLGYDLDVKTGVTLSLLHSLIGQYSQTNIHSSWTLLVDEVQSANKNAGTITPDTLSENLVELFKQPAITQIPIELTITQPEIEKIDWNQHQHATYLSLANLIGSWNEENKADIAVVQKIIGEDYSSWVIQAREILHLPQTPLSFRSGIWKINKRADMWGSLSSRIFDQNLDTFKDLAVSVLREQNPSFDLPREDRWAASIYSKVLTYSPLLRKGLAEGLAILGSLPEPLTNCSQGKAETIAVLTIRDVFTNADWVLWGSLDNLLPDLAEAAPDEFLKQVEMALKTTPCPFDELFSQEGDGIRGGIYITGLLRALEGLAWDENYLVRVCVVFGELASHDPGGNWTNRPDNSLVTILLPWLPRTTASIQKRKVAVKTLCNEQPKVGWKLLINLLPNQHQSSMGTHMPSWRKSIPDDWTKGVTKQEHWDQVSNYAEMAVSMAGHDTSKLAELIDHLNNLPKPSFDKLLGVLSSNVVTESPEDQRLILWGRLTKLTRKHRRHADAKWTLNIELVIAIETVADKLAPLKPLNRYQYLFSDRNSDLYDEKGNWDIQQKKLEERRQAAIQEILSTEGIKAVIQFAKDVESPKLVGEALSGITDTDIDSALLPEYLGFDDPKLSNFIGGYIWSRRYTNDWSWTDKLDKSSWTKVQIGKFLCFLPFTKETWERTEQWLGSSESEYWSIVFVNPIKLGEGSNVAIDKLLQYGRPNAAINCLEVLLLTNQAIDSSQCIRALLAALKSNESTSSMNSHDIVKLIKFLQNSSVVSHDDLFQIEWAYLPLLNTYSGTLPRTLENQLASSPDFFSEVIQLAYRPKNAEENTGELSEEKKKIAKNASLLLDEWKTPPGTLDDGSFDGNQFTSWLQSVRSICSESGHLDIALHNIGKVLIHSPADPNGWWINCKVAESLNAADVDVMRESFNNEIYNSRGVHVVDPTGKPERELAEQYKQKAEDIENAGFHRFAVTLRELASSYEKDAKRVIADHVNSEIGA